MKRSFKWLLGWLLVFALVAVPTIAMAATSQDVTITATPTYISISNTPGSEPLGTLSESSTVWAHGADPGDPIAEVNCTFNVTNEGSVATKVQIKATDFTGGDGWTLSNTTVGNNTVILAAGVEGDAQSAMVNLTTSNQDFIASLAASASKDWEFSLTTGNFTDGAEKSSTLTLTGTEVV